ncbi:MAG: PHP domain-containing protein [Clostridiales bacterium]|nr:PHP domain-containing protein [Clostridiales bacterium]
MKKELSYYDVFPKVIPVGKQATITVCPLGAHAAFEQGREYDLRVIGLDEGDPRNYPDRNNERTFSVIPDKDGCLRVTLSFACEQEYFIRLYNGEGKKTLQLSVYAVENDLAGRYPFLGDLHMHTCRSDGKESPAVVAANYRRMGYDFTVISDHQRYYPSLEAIDAYKDVKIDFNIVPGEEIHLPANDVHIVNFGSEYSVNGLVEYTAQIEERGKDKKYRSINEAACPETITQDEYERQVKELAEKLRIPDGIEKFSYAACVWIFNHIKNGNGLGIFCHPYWISNVYQVPVSFTEYMLEQKPFDAFEVFGGESYYQQNGFQGLAYYDMRIKGCDFPVVGSSDSHGSVNNPNACVAKTIVFSAENERTKLITSIKENYSVALDYMSKEYRLAGDFRLARYAAFLLDNYFELHDELCYEEGRLMKEYCTLATEESRKGLEAVYGRTDAMRKKYFAFD